jgi:HEAT repeat protein
MAALELVVAAVGGLVALGVHVSSKKRRSALWRARLEACGVTDIEQGDGFVGSGDVTGRRGRHEVRVERYHRGKNVRGTRVVARGLDEALSVRREGFGASVRKAFGSEEVVFGDPAFDQATWLRGSETVVRGLLDAETRMLVSHALGGTFHGPTGVVTCRDTTVEVENGELRVEFRDGFHSNDEPQVERLGAILSLAERLARAPDRAARLAHNARHDPVPGVRGRALATLADSFADDSATREAMRAALADEHPEVRLQAALWLEDEGRPTLASLAAASDVPDECSAVALDWLGPPDEATRGILDAASRLDRPRTLHAALAALARAGGAHVDVLAEFLRDPREHVAVSAAQALGASGSARAEEPLLAALEAAPDPVRQAAAGALGFVGTARSVMALKELRLRGSWGADPAAREAVARIQERLVGAGPGQLGLAGDAAGQVTLAADASGQVALAADGSSQVGDAGPSKKRDGPEEPS